jgi:hypothetical protein
MIYAGLTDFMACVKQDASWSPDIARLTQKFAYVPVLIYGTHQTKYSDHDLIKNYPARGFGHTTGAQYTMYKTGDGEPIVFDEAGGTNTAHIRGEIYQLPPPVLFKLDQQMCNGLHFNRQRITVRWWDIIQKSTPFDQRQDYVSEAFMYIGNRTELAKLSGFKNFRLLPRFNISPSEGHFYFFNPLEDMQHRRKKNLAAAETGTLHTHDV